MRTRNLRSASSSILEFTRAENAASFRTSRAGTRCMAALSVVSKMNCCGSPCTKAASVAIRAAEISAFGDTRSYGRQSQPGKMTTGTSGAKNRSADRIASIRLSSRAICSTGLPPRVISFRTRRASNPSGAPPMTTDCCGMSLPCSSCSPLSRARRLSNFDTYPKGLSQRWTRHQPIGS